MRKLTREKRPKKEAPTKEAVAADAIAETENRVPMFIIVPASSSEVIMLWLACMGIKGRQNVRDNAAEGKT